MDSYPTLWSIARYAEGEKKFIRMHHTVTAGIADFQQEAAGSGAAQRQKIRAATTHDRGERGGVGEIGSTQIAIEIDAAASQPDTLVGRD
jgi:hypothetical protein